MLLALRFADIVLPVLRHFVRKTTNEVSATAEAADSLISALQYVRLRSTVNAEVPDEQLCSRLRTYVHFFNFNRWVYGNGELRGDGIESRCLRDLHLCTARERFEDSDSDFF